MSTVTLPTAQIRAGARVLMTVVDRKESIYDPAQSVVGTPTNPNPGPGFGPGELATTVRTWVLQSVDNAALSIQVAELVGESDPSVEARLIAAGILCRAQAPTIVVRPTAAIVDAEVKPA